MEVGDEGRTDGRLAGVVCRRLVVDFVIKEAMGVWSQWAGRIALSNEAGKKISKVGCRGCAGLFHQGSTCFATF